MKYVTYFPSGEIEVVGQSPDADLAMLQNIYPRFLVVPPSINVSARTHYVQNGQFMERAEMDDIATLTGADNWQANGTDLLTYGGGLPAGTKVTISCDNPLFETVSTTVNDGTLSLTTTAPGNYVVHLSGFPFTDKTFTAVAV